MKIEKKLILSFGLLITILIGEMVVNQVIAYRAKKNFLELKEDISPTIQTLDEYKSINRELSLLNNTWVVSYNKRATNKIRAILDVELPHFKSKIATLKQGLEEDDQRVRFIESIIDQTETLIVLNNELNNLLVTTEDYENKVKMKQARKMISDETGPLHFVLDDAINRLEMLYNKQFETAQDNLLGNLESVSTIILILGILGILIGIVIARQVVNSILRSITNLNNLAKEVSSGKFGMQTELIGNDELTSLGVSLNSMSRRLEDIFLKNEKRIVELQEFSYIATHDLKVPIDNIKGFHTALMKDLDLENPRTKSIMEWIEKSANQAHRIIADLVKITQDGKLDFDEEVLDLNEISQSVQEFLDNKLTEVDGEIETHFSHRSVKYSKRQLISIFQNLMDNAIKYRSPDRKVKIEVSSKLVGEYVCLTFKDNGLGMDLDTQKEKLFGLFKRIYTNTSGSGIGLYMIKKSIEKNGGKIEVESKVGVGSTFFVYLKNK